MVALSYYCCRSSQLRNGTLFTSFYFYSVIFQKKRQKKMRSNYLSWELFTLSLSFLYIYSKLFVWMMKKKNKEITTWSQTPCHSSFSDGIICGPHRDHLRSILGIICGAVQYFPLRNFRLLYYPGMRYCYNTLLSNLRFIFCQVVAYGRLNKKENFKLLALKAIAVAYEKWSVTKGSKYSDLIGKLLVFWKTGRWGEVVAIGSLTVLFSRFTLLNANQTMFV